MNVFRVEVLKQREPNMPYYKIHISVIAKDIREALDKAEKEHGKNVVSISQLEGGTIT